jgi:hypothetical protein
MRKHDPDLATYEDDWPVRDIIIARTKYLRQRHLEAQKAEKNALERAESMLREKSTKAGRRKTKAIDYYEDDE